MGRMQANGGKGPDHTQESERRYAQRWQLAGQRHTLDLHEDMLPHEQ